MKTINGVSFEDWVCADELLGWGLPFVKVSEILGVDKPTWDAVHQAWREEIAEDQREGDPQQLVEKMLTLQENPLAYKFSHITKQEIVDVMEGDDEDDIADNTLELPSNGLTLDFLTTQDECDWVYLLNENLLNKSGAKFNNEEQTLYTVMCWFGTMSAGFSEFYKFYEDLADEVEQSLAVIGAKKHLKIFKKANRAYKKSQKIIQANDLISGKFSDTIYVEVDYTTLDNRFYDLENQQALKVILLEYAKNHINAFV